MGKQNTFWSSSRTYEISLMIGDINLTSDLVEFTIITSIDLPYQTFLLKLFLDPRDVIIQKIYGQTPMKVVINLLSTAEYPLERVEFDLMYLESDMATPDAIMLQKNVQQERTAININAVSRKAYQTMNTHVNDIFHATTIKSAISDLVKSTGASISYDNNNQNTEIIDQIIIPPSTLYKNLHYINRTFGAFDGYSIFYCSYENMVYVKNLSNKMKQSQTITIYQLALDSNNDDIIKQCNDGIHYYTQQKINSNYKGNSVFAFHAPQGIYIVKPRDRLYQNIEVNLEKFTAKYGLITKSDEIFYDKTTLTPDKRKTIYKDHSGYELSQSFINANNSKSISDISNLTIKVENNIKILKLMNVGESVEITTGTAETSKITGRYILKTSEIKFNKLKDWEGSAVLFLIRSNRNLV